MLAINSQILGAAENSTLQNQVKELEKKLSESQKEMENMKEQINSLTDSKKLSEGILHRIAIRNYEDFKGLEEGSATLEQVQDSSAGVFGWAQDTGEGSSKFSGSVRGLQDGMWLAEISIGRKVHRVGKFSSKAAAHCALSRQLAQFIPEVAKVGSEKKVKKTKRTKRASSPRPLSGYSFFCKQNKLMFWDRETSTDGHIGFLAFMSQKWKDLSEEEKNEWTQMSIETFNRSQGVLRRNDPATGEPIVA